MSPAYPNLLFWHWCLLAQQRQKAWECLHFLLPRCSLGRQKWEQHGRPKHRVVLKSMTWVLQASGQTRSRPDVHCHLPGTYVYPLGWAASPLCATATHFTSSVRQGGSISTKAPRLPLKYILLGNTLLFISNRKSRTPKLHWNMPWEMQKWKATQIWPLALSEPPHFIDRNLWFSEYCSLAFDAPDKPPYNTGDDSSCENSYPTL